MVNKKMTPGLWISTILVFLSVMLWLSENSKVKRLIRKIPGPPTLPFFGNAHLFKPDGSGKLMFLS